ncbi:MAG: hypothetical protein ACTHOL_07725 [Luteibacter jiangsuensis]
MTNLFAQTMRLLAPLIVLMVPVSAPATAQGNSSTDVALKATTPLHCPEAIRPFAYRVSYIGVNKYKVNFPGVVFLCLEHELQSQSDWNDLQKRIVGDGLEITIMGANRVPSSDKSPN